MYSTLEDIALRLSQVMCNNKSRDPNKTAILTLKCDWLYLSERLTFFYLFEINSLIR